MELPNVAGITISSDRSRLLAGAERRFAVLRFHCRRVTCRQVRAPVVVARPRANRQSRPRSSCHIPRRRQSRSRLARLPTRSGAHADLGDHGRTAASNPARPTRSTGPGPPRAAVASRPRSKRMDHFRRLPEREAGTGPAAAALDKRIEGAKDNRFPPRSGPQQHETSGGVSTSSSTPEGRAQQP